MKLSFEQTGNGLYIRTDVEDAALTSLLIRGAAGVALRLAGYDAGHAQRIARALGPQMERTSGSGMPTRFHLSSGRTKLVTGRSFKWAQFFHEWCFSR